MIGIFAYLCICEVKTTKVYFRFYKQCSQAATRLICERAIFVCKMLVSPFTSNILLHIEKNPVEKLCKVLEMELKTYTPVGPKFVFQKIKFNVLHYIQHDFIRRRAGRSKDQASTFKNLVMNQLL